MPQSNDQWSIELHQRSILGGTHLFWALRNPQGRIDREVHGFATGPQDDIKPHSMPWQGDDTIKLYEIDRAELRKERFDRVLGGSFDAEFQVEPHETAFVGPRDEALKIWRKGLSVADAVNSANIDYRLVGVLEPGDNSNSVAYTLGKYAGLKTEGLRDPRTGARSYTPGWGSDLFEHAINKNKPRTFASDRRPSDFDYLDDGP